MKDEITMIPIERIRIINPRPRDKKKFELIVQSIKNLGLKKPIQVSLRSAQEGDEPGYDLVCGQGRIEAFLALGHKGIPAIVVSVSREERLLRSFAGCYPSYFLCGPLVFSPVYQETASFYFQFNPILAGRNSPLTTRRLDRARACPPASRFHSPRTP